MDDDPYTPYDPLRRLGGALGLLYHYDEAAGNFLPTRPTAIGADYLKYPYTLPTPTELPQLRKFVIAIPKLTTISCQATDPLSGRVITSNALTLLIQAPAYQLGPYTVRETLETPGSAVGAAIRTDAPASVNCRPGRPGETFYLNRWRKFSLPPLVV